MKKAALVLTLMATFLFTMVSGAKAVQFDYEQFEGLPYDHPIVTILAPSSNATYSVSDVPLNVTVQIFGFIYHNWERIKWLNYSLDGQPAIPITFIVPSDLYPGYHVYGNDVLTGLSDGTHNLTIYGETAVGGLTGNFNATVFFRVDTSTTPNTEPFLTTLGIGAVVATVIIVTGLFVYFKKCKY